MYCKLRTESKVTTHWSKVSIVIPSWLLSFVILNSSCTLPYPKGEKIGWQSRPYLQVNLKFFNPQFQFIVGITTIKCAVAKRAHYTYYQLLYIENTSRNVVIQFNDVIGWINLNRIHAVQMWLACNRIYGLYGKFPFE